MIDYIKKYILIFFLLTVPVLSQTEKVTVAISDFENSTGLFSNSELEKSVPEMLKTDLSQYEKIIVLERSKIQSVFQEHALIQSGVIDPEQAQKVGELVGARFVLTGEISKVGDRYRLDTHLVDVESGKVFGEKVTGPNLNSLESMVRVLANNIIVNLTGEGKRQTRVKVRDYYAPWVLAAGVGTGIVSVMMHSSYKDNWEKYENAARLNEFDDYYDKANKSYKARNAMVGVTLGIITVGTTLWLKNKSQGNEILAQRADKEKLEYVLLPYYNFNERAIGVQLTLFKL